MSKSVPVEVPTLLSEAVKSRRAVLFLGAGASREARNPKGESPPDADGLRDIIAEAFFKKPMKKRDVMAVAEMAIGSAGGAPQVYETVRRAFEGFAPSRAHKLVANFNWRMIATTNYDLLLEQAYEANQQRAQELIRFVKDSEPIEERLQSVPKAVPYLKLHGCLEHIHDPEIPLVLAREQFDAYSNNRVMLFNRLRMLARESALVFVGYRLQDAHIRELVYRLSSDKRPRWYIVSPDADQDDERFWATKNIEVIQCKFGELMDGLDAAVPQLWRGMSPSDAVLEFPIRKFFVSKTIESASLNRSLEIDLTLVHAGIAVQDQTPKSFYEGYDPGWGAIVRRFDVRRKVEDDLLYKTLLENEKPIGPVLLMLRGAAGAGKTIALKRTAYEAAVASGALVLWLHDSGALRPDNFAELFDLTNRPIYLFVDQVALHVEKLHQLLIAARSRRIPLVVVGAEREADWNTYCSPLETDFTPTFVRVGNLSEPEVEGLLDLLERHHCLGLLKDLTREDQLKAFMEKERADRQLLVALYELTQGKPFAELLLMEHQRVQPQQARQLYLDIATMHQFSVVARAGVISRISGVDFEDYRAHFFSPLENMVRVEEDPYTGDYSYLTRHARVAGLVFRQVCPDDQSKARQFKRLIEGFDVGYSADRRALEEITRGRALAESFAGVDDARSIYETAVSIAPSNAFLHQQWAIFESTHQHGDLALAEVHASRAHDLDPRSKAVVHTQAEIDRKRANDESSPLLKDTLRRRARERLSQMPSQDRFAVSSRCKLLVDEIYELSAGLTEETKAADAIFFAERLKDTEASLQRAQEQFPEDADIIQVEARLRGVLDQQDMALRALERAWRAGPRGSGTAIRIARIYDSKGRADDASAVLKEALTRNPEDKPTHYAIAMHNLAQSTYDSGVVESHLSSSFSIEDQNYEARYMLAQFFFLTGDVHRGMELFDQIDKKAPDSFRRTLPSTDTAITSRLPRYSGSIESMKDRFLFIRCGNFPRSVFGHFSHIAGDVLEELAPGRNVNFKVRFSRVGPGAVDIRIGRAN